MDNLAYNKKAKFDYFLEDSFEAGIVLQGWEVKSILAKKISINNSYVIIKNREAFLLNCDITPMQQASTHKLHENTRTRKLLLHKAELNKLIGKTEIKGYTLIPISLYINKKIKLKFALSLGKKQYDKRESIKNREVDRELERATKKAFRS